MAVLDAMGRKRKQTNPDDRVAAIVLKDSPAYRDWVTGLSQATLIPAATIVRDALAKWAAERGLPAPPSGPGSKPKPKGAVR
jgi:hypothetical protein